MCRVRLVWAHKPPLFRMYIHTLSADAAPRWGPSQLQVLRERGGAGNVDGEREAGRERSSNTAADIVLWLAMLEYRTIHFTFLGLERGRREQRLGLCLAASPSWLGEPTTPIPRYLAAICWGHMEGAETEVTLHVP